MSEDVYAFIMWISLVSRLQQTFLSSMLISHQSIQFDVILFKEFD